MRSRRVRVYVTLALCFVILPLFWQGTQPPSGAPDARPRTAANVATNNSYPTMNHELYAGSAYNFTQQVRDDTSFGRVWDSANLQVDKGDCGYSNTSLTNLGTYNATLTFDGINNRPGGLPWNFTCTGAVSVVSAFAGHLGVLYEASGTTSAATHYFTPFTEGNYSYWYYRSTGAGGYGTYNYLYNSAGSIWLTLCQMDDGSWHLLDDTGWHNDFYTSPVARWYYIDIGFSYAQNLYTLIIDGTLCYSGVPDYCTNFGSSQFAESNSAACNMYIDAIDWTGEAGYALGRNAIDRGQVGIYNGTLSFENSTVFDQVGDNNTVLSHGNWTTDCGAYQGTQAMDGVEKLASASAITGAGWTCALGTAGHGTYNSGMFTQRSQYITIARGGNDDFFWYPMVSQTYAVETWIASAVNSGEWVGFFITGSTGALSGHYAGGIYIGGATFNYITDKLGTTAAIPGAPSLAVNTWYNVRVEWSNASNYYRIYINGVKLVDTTAWSLNSVVSRTYIGLTTVDTTAYFDAISLGTDAGYYTGMSNQTEHDLDNLNAQALVVPQVPTGAYGHHNILMLNDQTSSGAPICNYTLPNILTAGVLEFWYLTTDNTKTAQVALWSTTGAQVSLINIYNSGGVLYSWPSTTNLGAMSNNVWYHVRISWASVAGGCSIWVNGLLRASGLAFNTLTTTGVGRVQIAGESSHTTYSAFFDALDVSSDTPAYYLERSSWMFLNSTQSFPVPDAYAYRWSVWSANVEYFATSYTPFTVVPNVQFISESSVATTWLLGAGQWSTIYTADFTEAWSSNHNENITSGEVIFAQDAYTDEHSSLHDTNYGSSTILQAGKDGATISHSTFVDVGPFAEPYLLSNASRAFHIYVDAVSGSPSHFVCAPTTIFNESTITYHNQPTSGGSAYTSALSVGWNIVHEINSPTLGHPIYNITRRYAHITEDDLNDFNFTSKESGNVPHTFTNISKVFHGANLAYIQTNKTELMELRSPTVSLPLLANDRIIVTFSTTSTKEIDLYLKSGGTTVKSFTGTSALMIPPNTNYASQTKTLTITGPISVDGIVFSGELDAYKNLQVTSFIVQRPVQPYYVWYLGPQESREVPAALNASTMLTVYEGTTMVYNVSAPISQNTKHVFTYSPTAYGERIVNFYDQNNNLLDFALFRVLINRTLNNISSPVNPDSPYYMKSNIFYADTATLYNITVFDRFSQQIYDADNQPITSFIDITLTLYSLKVQNAMVNSTIFSLTNNSVSDSQYLLPGELIEYRLYAGTYDISYIQTETGTSVAATISVTEASLYVINTTVKQLYFVPKIVTGASADSFSLGLNATGYGWGGPIAWLGSYVNIGVADWWDNAITGSIRYEGNTVGLGTVPAIDGMLYEIIIDVYSLTVQNRMRNSTLVQIYDGTHTLHWDQYVMPDGGEIEYQLGAGTYSLEYHNPETGADIVESITIAGAAEYIMNTSWYSVYVSCFSNDLLGLPGDTVRVYLDGARVQWPGPVDMLGATHNITAMDYFNDTQYTALLDFSPYAGGEFNIFINMATLSIFNNDSINYFTFNITKSGLVLLSQPIAPLNFLIFRFTTGSYTIDCYFENNTLYSTQYVNLAANDTQLISFGVQPAHVYTYSIIPITPQGIGLPWEEFVLTIDGSPASWGVHSTDALSINATVTDYFGNVINSTIFSLYDGANFLLMVSTYNFKISNLMRGPSLVNWTMNGISTIEYVMPGETTRWNLFGGNYVLEYTNPELGTSVTLAVTIAGAGFLQLNTSYYNILFNSFSNDGLGIPAESVKLYVNGTRKAWGNVELLGDPFNITVTDFFNETLFTTVTNLTGLAEYSIFINMVTVITMNNQRNETIALNITRNGISMVNQTIGYGNSILFRFTRGNYSFACTFQNGTVETKTVDASSGDIAMLDFGVFLDAAPPDLTDVKPGFMEIILALCFLIGVIILIVVVLTIAWRNSTARYRKLAKLQEETKNKIMYGLDSGIERRLRKPT